MASPALQEIVAVLAAPAAGNPAQYLFERAVTAAGLDWQVVTCDVAPERIAEAIAGAAAMGFRGCLIAGSLQERALPLATSASPAATFAGGVGLLAESGDGFAGHMMEGRGVIEAVRLHADPASRDVLVLGAGLAGRAVALELALAGVASIAVADPDPEQAARLVQDLAAVNAAAPTAVEWTGPLVVPEPVGIVVRTIREPLRLDGLRSDMLLAEIAAESDPSPEAVAAGCCLVAGLEIRAVQAAIEFQTLTGVETDIEVLREALDEYLS
jgi:shikimate dehydrogenase